MRRATLRHPELLPTPSLGLVCLSSLLFTSLVLAEDWPQFRGPNCTGISSEQKSLPIEFSATKNVSWMADVGDGIGCPVVAAGRVFTSGMIDDQTLGLFAFEASSGKELWRKTWPTPGLMEVHKTNSHASTTPAADADRVYFYFKTLGMLALDAKTGDLLWQQKLPKPFFVFKWGAGMSPVLYKDKVIFCQDDDLYPALYAFDKRTGNIDWKDDRSDMAVNYSHPVICKTKSGDELIVAGTGKLIGYDPSSGQRLWHAKTLLRNIKTTPVCVGDTIYISLQSGGIANQWLASVDQVETGNSDGKLTKAEMQAFVGETEIPEAFYQRTFDRGDENKDGYLEGAEFDAAFLFPDNFAGATFDSENPADEYILAVRAGGRGDVTDTHLIWKHPTKHTDHIVSPFVHDGRMLLVKGGGITTAFETATGQQIGKPSRIPNASDHFASPVYGNGKIYVAGYNGRIIVLEDGPDYKVLARNDMHESIAGTPAISDGRLFVRTRTKLYSIGSELSLTDDLQAKCLEILRQAVRADEFWPSMHAAEALTLAGHAADVRAMLEPKLEIEQDDQRRCGVARELVRAGDRQRVSILHDILTGQEPHGHVHAAESLYKVAEIGDGLALRKVFSQSSNPTQRLMAAAALGRCGSPEALKFIRQKLTDPDPELSRIAAWILARIGDPSDVDQLRKNVTEAADGLVRCYSQHALAALGDTQGLKALQENLLSDDPAIRTYAATFAGDARATSTADTLVRLLDDTNIDVRVRAAQSLLALSQPAPLDRREDVSQLVYQATDPYPRWTEGSIVQLFDRSLLYAVTQFLDGGSDFSRAQIVARRSDDGGRTWQPQRVLQESSGKMNVMSATLRRLRSPNENTIGLFYLEKNSHDSLHAYVRFSTDEATTFGPPILITSEPGYHVMNNDRITQLSSGRLLAPVATTPDVQKVNHFVSLCWHSDDGGKSWRKGTGQVDQPKRGAMEPEVIELADGRVMMIVRTQLGVIANSYSADGGDTWSEPERLSVQAPEAPATLRRIPATGDLLLIWNNTFTAGAGHGGSRTPLTAAISSDEGKTWTHVRNLETDSGRTYSYTSLMFANDRAVISYWEGLGDQLSSKFRSLPISWFYQTPSD